MALEELNSALARYMPDRQLITFSQDIKILPKVEASKKTTLSLDIRETSYFFHEWMHYLHNISTLHGIGAFVALAEIWSAFRFTTDSLGISSGQINHTDPESFQVKSLIAIIAAARKSMNLKLPRDIAPGDVSVKAFAEKNASESVVATQLEISIVLKNKLGDQTTSTMTLGPGELLESVAFLLEKRFLERLAGLQTEQFPVVPYHVLTIFAHHIDPSLTEEDVLLCGLFSLQFTSPVSDLENILRKCASIDSGSGKRRQYLEKLVIEHMTLYESEYQEWLNRLDRMFPLEKSMGRAVIETIRYMRKNLLTRKERPFFELDFIEEMHHKGASHFHEIMNRLMTTHGMCAGKQEHPGLIDEIERDQLFDFTITGQDEELRTARRVMLASFEYVLRHISNDNNGFLDTKYAKNFPCPFYTSCNLQVRHNKPEICKTQPWRTLEFSADNLCWYAEGVLNLRPGI